MVSTILLASCFASAAALDNAFRLPPLGWSSWYGFTSNIDEELFKGIGEGLIAPRLLRNGSQVTLAAVGFRHVWCDDGFALPRDSVTQKIVVDPVLFPSGFRNLSDTLHAQGLFWGVYTSKGPLTCLAYAAGQPKRPGSCGFEELDADTYANDWQVDQLKDDGCGDCPQHDPFIAMRDALNATGRQILYQTHSAPNGTVANAWRTGGDLYASNFDSACSGPAPLYTLPLSAPCPLPTPLLSPPPPPSSSVDKPP